MAFANYDKLSKEIRNIMLDSYTSKPRDYVGLSTVGDPVYLLALKKLGYYEKISCRTHMVFFTGHLWEAILIDALKSYGVPIHSEQQEVYYAGFPGHIDAMVGDSVLEIKTMSDSPYNRFLIEPRSKVNYVYQLGCYSHCMKADKAGWLILNKQTFEIAYVPYDMDALDFILESVEKKSQCLSCVNTINDLQSVEVVEPRKEIFQKKETGRSLIPQCYAYSSFVNAIYNIGIDINGYGKETRYVESIKTFEETLNWLNNYTHKL